MNCAHCNIQLEEVSRNEHFVFYRCGCGNYANAGYDWKTALIDGVEYLMGLAGSYVHTCPNCYNRIYRMRPSTEVCLWCNESRVELTPMYDSMDVRQ